MSHLLHTLNMGGYAAYVWSAYGAAALVVLFNIFLTRKSTRLTKKMLRQHWEQSE